MRTKTLLLTAALVAAGVASSMAQSNVYSLNIVGYVNIPVVAGKFYLMENPLSDGSSNNVNSVFSSLNANAFNFDGSAVFTFSGGTYHEDDYNASATNNGSWSPGTSALSPGVGFWFTSPNNGTITFVGSVTLSNSIALVPGFSLVGSAYPASANMVGLGLNNLANANGFNNDGDAIFRFDVPTQAFVEYDFNAGSGWTPGSTNGPTLNVGEGIFYGNVNNTNNWNQSFTVN